MSRHNTAFFLALADLSETVAIAALDEFVRRKDGDAMDAFMVAVLVDQDAFPWFLGDQTFKYSRPKAEDGPDHHEGTGYELLLKPVSTRDGERRLNEWQIERLQKAIAFGLALPDPTHWMTVVAHHLAMYAPEKDAVDLFQHLIKMHNAKPTDGTNRSDVENPPVFNIVQSTIDRQPARLHETVDIDYAELAVEALKYPVDQALAIRWIQSMTHEQFKEQEGLLFKSLTYVDSRVTFMLTMIQSRRNDGGRSLADLKSLFDWLGKHSDPDRIATLRLWLALQVVRDMMDESLIKAKGLDDLVAMMGLDAEDSMGTLKTRLAAMMGDADDGNVKGAIMLVEIVIAKNLTELFPLIDGHPALNATTDASHLVGKALDGAFALQDGRAGAARLRQTLEFLVRQGLRLERLKDEKSAITHLAASLSPYAQPEKLAVLLSMGQDPSAPDPAGKTAEVFLKETDRDAWEHVAKTFAARRTALGLLEAMDATVQSTLA